MAIHGVVRGSIGHEFLFDGPHDGVIAEVELVLAIGDGGRSSAGHGVLTLHVSSSNSH